MRIRTWLAFVLALALLAAACGGDDDTAATDDGTAATDESAADDGTGATDESEQSDADADGDTDAEEPDADSDTDAEEPDAEPESTVPVGPIEPRELSILSIDLATGQVELRNNTDAEIVLDGHTMCNFPTYAPIEGVGAIGPGEVLVIQTTVGLPAADGELGIYSGGDFANPDDIVAYVEWGSSGHARAEVAIEAGIWDGVALTPDGTVLTVGS